MQDELQGALQDLHAHASQLLSEQLSNWMNHLAQGNAAPVASHLPAVAQALHTVRDALAPFIQPPASGNGHDA
jgi:hypothetical protein